MMDMDRSVFNIICYQNGSVRFQLKLPNHHAAQPLPLLRQPYQLYIDRRKKGSMNRMNSIDRELIEATKENNLPEVSRLLGAGADVNAKENDDDDWTSLHWACKEGHSQVFKELLEHGADIDVEDNHGDTPLHLACYCGHVAVVKTLVSVGVDILAVNNNGCLPVHHALSGGHSAVAKYLLRELYATTRRLPLHELLEDVTWIGNPRSSGAPPLCAALRWNVLGMDDVVEILEYLVDLNPALLSSHDQDGSLPLHVACRRGAAFTIVQSLVDLYEASVKSVTPQGDLPLFLASEMHGTSLDTIFILVKLFPDLVYR
jgi:ankyrin repeat protein